MQTRHDGKRQNLVCCYMLPLAAASCKVRVPVRNMRPVGLVFKNSKTFHNSVVGYSHMSVYTVCGEPFQGAHVKHTRCFLIGRKNCQKCPYVPKGSSFVQVHPSGNRFGWDKTCISNLLSQPCFGRPGRFCPLGC